MKKSGYRSILHIYLIFFISLIGTILAAFVIFLMLVTVRKPDGETAVSYTHLDVYKRQRST